MKPSKEQITLWKSEHDEIFSLEADSKTYVYRSLTFKEYDIILASMGEDNSSVDAEDDIVRVGLLWPEDFNPNLVKPGIITTLAQRIKSHSCLDGDVYHARDLLEESRVKVSGFRGEMDSFILFAMPQYKMDELSNMTFRKLSELVAMAEKVIYLRQISEGIDVERPIRLRMYTQEELEEVNGAKISDGGNATIADPIAQKLMAAMG